MDKSWKHYAEWKKNRHESPPRYGSTYIKYTEQVDPQRQKRIGEFAMAGKRE